MFAALLLSAASCRSSTSPDDGSPAPLGAGQDEWTIKIRTS